MELTLYQGTQLLISCNYDNVRKKSEVPREHLTEEPSMESVKLSSQQTFMLLFLSFTIDSQ